MKHCEVVGVKAANFKKSAISDTGTEVALETSGFLSTTKSSTLLLVDTAESYTLLSPMLESKKMTSASELLMVGATFGASLSTWIVFVVQ